MSPNEFHLWYEQCFIKRIREIQQNIQQKATEQIAEMHYPQRGTWDSKQDHVARFDMLKEYLTLSKKRQYKSEKEVFEIINPLSTTHADTMLGVLWKYLIK